MVASIGRLQHLAEPRSLSHKLSETYRTQCGTHFIDGTWYLELLLVFAIGQLLQGEAQDVDGQPPGFAYFQQAMDLLPNPCILQGLGAIGIEITGFITFYLQCSDRKDDAYVYVRSYSALSTSVVEVTDI
jgi:proline utilization trans-activator